MLLVANGDFKEWVGLAVVVVDDLTMLATNNGLEAYEILHVELVIVTLLLFDEYFATHEPLLGATLGVYVIEMNYSARLAATLE